MQQILIILIMVSAAANYVMFKERDALLLQQEVMKQNQATLETAIEDQKAAIETLKQENEKQADALIAQGARNAEIEQEMNRYLDIFRRHNLNQLASAKPALIEKRVNEGTKKVFEGIENDSKTIENLGN